MIVDLCSSHLDVLVGWISLCLPKWNAARLSARRIQRARPSDSVSLHSPPPWRGFFSPDHGQTSLGSRTCSTHEPSRCCATKREVERNQPTNMSGRGNSSLQQASGRGYGGGRGGRGQQQQQPPHYANYQQQQPGYPPPPQGGAGLRRGPNQWKKIIVIIPQYR